MLKDDNARVPFAAIGILLLIFSTIITVYLAGMQSTSISESAADDRDRGINAAITLAISDLGSALNYAGMYACSEAGKSPVINRSGQLMAYGDVNEDRIRKLAFARFSKYLEANYNGSFTHGDYTVSARADGDYRSLEISRGNMTLYRNFDHPVVPCGKDYSVYYVLTMPVQITVTKTGSTQVYTERRLVRTIVTSRYPLLKEMATEYERRLNGTPMMVDITAASYAYTWTRGYSQYAFGYPLNVIDNGDMELIANGATLLEQGFEFNSVDPLSLGALLVECAGGDASPSNLNNYSLTNNSARKIPGNRTGKAPDRFNFTIDEIVDRAHDEVFYGGYAENTYQGAYTAGMYLTIVRDADYYPRENRTVIIEETPQYLPVSGRVTGYEKVLIRTFRAYKDNSDGNGYADRVIITYIMSQYSVLEYFGEGKYATSAELIGEPVLQPSRNDVASPLYPFEYIRELSFGEKRFRDDNLRFIVEKYEESFDQRPGEQQFNTMLLQAVGERSSMPSVYTSETYRFTCGPDNQYPVWAEIESNYEIDDLCRDLKNEIRVSIDPQNYGGSPSSMSGTAYAELARKFSENYDRYLDRPAYVTSINDESTGKREVYRSCGSKAIYRIRHKFLDDVRRRLNDAVNQSGQDVNRTIDRAMKDTGMNTTHLTDGARQSRGYLDNNLYIQFGLSMDLNSSEEFSGGYPWEEKITLALDQSPDYLNSDLYRDKETGYSVRPLKLRNICLFAVPAGNLDTGYISDAMAAPILDGIDAVASAASETGNATIMSDAEKLSDNVADLTRDSLKKEIEKAVREDPGLKDTITKADIDRAVEKAYARRGNNSTGIVRDLKDGSIRQEVASQLINQSASAIQNKAHDRADQYADEYARYIRDRIEEQVKSAEERAIAETTEKLKVKIRELFRGFSREASDTVLRKGANAALEQAMSRIPCGVPLLPPYGWWETANVWYIEVQGEIPSLTVYDADNEPVPNPVFGHEATCYTRRWQAVNDENDRLLGWNEPVRFCVKTCTFIIVPPGQQGVGDKGGDWDEKSPGFEETWSYP